MPPMAGRAGPRQLPLDLAGQPAFSRDDFVVSAANRAAVAFIEGWRDDGHRLAVLAGPPGSGKSHLAAIWGQARDAVALDRRGLGPEAAAAAERRAVLIDDADAGGLDETGLFHLINAARAAGNPVLLAARRFPAAWGVVLADLSSRLAAATTMELFEPDDLLLSGVLTKLFADRQVEVEPPVVRFLVRRMERSVAAAIGLVEKLDRRALETKSRITRRLASEVLGEMEAARGDAGP